MNPLSRPALVYNCYYLRALCENVNNFAPPKGWTFPRLLHHDRDFKLAVAKEVGVLPGEEAAVHRLGSTKQELMEIIGALYMFQ